MEDELGEGGGEGRGVAGLDLSGLLGEGRERDGEAEERDCPELEEWDLGGLPLGVGREELELCEREDVRMSPS